MRSIISREPFKSHTHAREDDNVDIIFPYYNCITCIIKPPDIDRGFVKERVIDREKKANSIKKALVSGRNKGHVGQKSIDYVTYEPIVLIY